MYASETFGRLFWVDDNYGEKVDRLVDNMGMKEYKWDEQFYNEIVKDSKFSYGKFSEVNYPLHLQQSWHDYNGQC